MLKLPPKHRTLATLVAMWVALPSIATAMDHFVRPAQSGGYGSNSGSMYLDAWNSLSGINWASVAAGDTVYICGFHGGYADNSIDVAASGTAGSPIVFSGDCPVTAGTDKGVIIGTNAVLSGWSDADGDGVYTMTGYAGCTAPFLLEEEAGFPLSEAHPGIRQRWAKDQFADLTDPPTNLLNWLPGTFDQPTCGGTVYFKPADAGRPPRTTYAGAGASQFLVTNRSYITIRKMHLFGSNRGIELHHADHVTMENNEIQWAYNNVDTQDNSDFGILQDNVIHDSRGVAVTFITGSANSDAQSNDNWLVAGNEIYNVSVYCDSCGLATSPLGDRHAIGIQGGGNNNVFEFNHIHHVGGEGILYYNWSNRAGGNLQQNNVIRYNYIHDVKDLNPYCLAGQTNKCSGEYGIALGSDSSPPAPATIMNNRVYGNVLARIHGKAFRTKSTKPASGFTWSFVNNTTIDSGIGVEFVVYDAGTAPGHLGGAEFRNNIVYDSTADSANPHVLATRGNNAVDTTGFAMTNNTYFPDGPTMFKWSVTCCVETSNLAGWAAISGITETGSLTLDPLFVDPTASGNFIWAGTPSVIAGGGDFRLQGASSPARNAGTSVGVITDILRNPVAGTPDMGAYEFPYADLSITLTDSPDPVQLGQSVTYMTTVMNNGPLTAMGVNATGTLPLCNIGTLLPNTSGACNAPIVASGLTLPTQTMTAAGAETDLTPANNSASASTTVQAPDLLEATLTAPISGTNFLINDQVRNSGNGTAGGFVISYYLSINATYEAGLDTLLSCSPSRTIASLAAGAFNPASGTTQSTCAIPSVAAGNYYVVAQVDSGSAVTESNESNNTTASSVVAIGGKDLLPTVLTAARVSGNATKVTISDTVKNQGSTNAGSFTIRYYISTNTTYESGTDKALATTANGSTPCNRAPSSLAAGASSPSTGKICHKPAGAQNGVAYYVLVYDDSANTQVEYNESNNVKAATNTIQW